MVNKEKPPNNHYTVPRKLLNIQTIDAVITQLGWVEDPFREKRRKWLTRDGLTVTITVHMIELSDLEFFGVRFSFLNDTNEIYTSVSFWRHLGPEIQSSVFKPTVAKMVGAIRLLEQFIRISTPEVKLDLMFWASPIGYPTVARKCDIYSRAASLRAMTLPGDYKPTGEDYEKNRNTSGDSARG